MGFWGLYSCVAVGLEVTSCHPWSLQAALTSTGSAARWAGPSRPTPAPQLCSVGPPWRLRLRADRVNQDETLRA